MQKEVKEWEWAESRFLTTIKIPVHVVRNAPYGGLGRVACDVNPVSRG